ncbi:MAG: hypothetical protein GY810_12660 [Aureispira sp.]|nr:hypothetical protein [Aureispira sp.]
MDCIFQSKSLKKAPRTGAPIESVVIKSPNSPSTKQIIRGRLDCPSKRMIFDGFLAEYSISILDFSGHAFIMNGRGRNLRCINLAGHF